MAKATTERKVHSAFARITPETQKRLRKHMIDRNRSSMNWIAEAIEEKLDREKAPA